MLALLPAPDHVAAFHMSGTLTAEDFDHAVAEIEARLARHPRIGVFVDMTGFEDITAKAAARDLRYAFGKIREWHRFPREAVVTDKQWVRTLVQVVSPLVPWVEARAFAPAERDDALAWASEIPRG